MSLPFMMWTLGYSPTKRKTVKIQTHTDVKIILNAKEWLCQKNIVIQSTMKKVIIVSHETCKCNTSCAHQWRENTHHHHFLAMTALPNWMIQIKIKQGWFSKDFKYEPIEPLWNGNQELLSQGTCQLLAFHAVLLIHSKANAYFALLSSVQ